MQLDLLSGLMSDQSGQDHLHANRFQLPENKEEKRTKDTSGLSGSISSESLDLQSFLENRLAQQLIKDGSINCKKTWKQKVTPQGLSYSQLQVSVLSTKEKDFFLWATPNARDWKDTAGQTIKRENNRTRIDQVPRQAFQLIGATATTPDFGTENAGHYQLNPRFSLWLMGYPTEWASCGEQVTQLSLKSLQK